MKTCSVVGHKVDQLFFAQCRLGTVMQWDPMKKPLLSTGVHPETQMSQILVYHPLNVTRDGHESVASLTTSSEPGEGR